MVMVHLGISIFAILEISNNYEASFKISILESLSTCRVPPLHATTSDNCGEAGRGHEGTASFGCRGGCQYVEGCGGVPLLENTNSL